jgi:hypothetical protein
MLTTAHDRWQKTLAKTSYLLGPAHALTRDPVEAHAETEANDAL